MSVLPRYVLCSLIALSWLAAGCSDSKKIDLGGGCLLNSDCNSPLSCSFGKCHETCVETRDCPLGQTCVKTPQGGVCQLPVDSDCQSSCGACPIGLVCAADQRCRASCQTAAECLSDQVCANGTCAESGNVDGTGQLKPSGAAGTACVLDSDCSLPLRCVLNRCHYLCQSTNVCPTGQSCVKAAATSVCQLPVEALCDGSTGCAGGLVCAVDYRCRVACNADGDCTPGQKCAGGVCADSGELNPSGQLTPKSPPTFPDGGMPDAAVADLPAISPADVALEVQAPEVSPAYDSSSPEGVVDASDVPFATPGLDGGGAAGIDAAGDAGGADGPGTGGATGTGGLATGGAAGVSGYGVPGQSCSGMTGTECNGESCCTSIPLPQGTFMMGRGSEACSNCTDGCPGGISCNVANAGVETPEHSVTVSAFSLDKYEVTVGRFRSFVVAYDGLGAPPPVDSGAHPKIPGTGWQEAWNGNLPADRSTFEKNLSCDGAHQTWTKADDQLPINCVNWFQAFAFCVWDGGRLPTDAEWEYAAAGGDENRLYPWGATPAPSCAQANYTGCVGDPARVGSYAAFPGRWGHLDLAGNEWEWVFDPYSATWYSDAAASGTDPANTESASGRVVRGCTWNAGSYSIGCLRSVFRSALVWTSTNASHGFRCARSP
jgi:sulfatase modifying factor 1